MSIDSETDGRLTCFFLPPCAVEDLPEQLRETGIRPVLHLLRRDLVRLYHDERILSTIDKSHGPPFLVCLGILSGIDLLVRFFTPELVTPKTKKPRKLGNGERFTLFLRKVGKVRQADAQFLWAFRNALSHSYGVVLHGEPFNGAAVKLTAGNREARWLTKKTIHHMGRPIRHYTVNMWKLKELFLQVVGRCEMISRNKRQRLLRKRFRTRYDSHGYIVIGPEREKAHAS